LGEDNEWMTDPRMDKTVLWFVFGIGVGALLALALNWFVT
jgi:hypothetical protein